MDLEQLFVQLYSADTENDLDHVIESISGNTHVSWTPYGDNESFFGVIENQQASPVPALVEKVTNSIDAILMRRCLEAGIDPKGSKAPKSVNEGIETFFSSSQSWDLPGKRSFQAESIQILARGPRNDTSLIIYDDGEGQHPQDFGDTFLSLLRGNKNEIPFVQGKYNMGGAGAVVFCGKKRYQLVASKRFDQTGKFGFTIMRKHPLSAEEEATRKNTWYEYLLVDGQVPSFEIDSLDLGLHNREFTTGTIIKLYSYNLPAGSRSVISRDLNQSINEFLFEPALPIYTIDIKERYPKDRALERHLYGLKRRLEEDGSKYIRSFFSESYNDSEIGSLKITVYVFNPRIDGKSAKETKEAIKREFFKNNMSVMFALNGQVHGSFTSEFITRSLKYNLLKDYLLIHVDCTNLKNSFRTELFMGSRDRLKQGEECSQLRKLIADILTKGRLKEIYKEWKDSITTQSDSAEDLLKDFSKHLPMNKDLMKLLGNTFALDAKDDKKDKKRERQKPKSTPRQEIPFNPKRFPSVFDIDLKSKDKDQVPLTKIPLGGDKTLSFSTDVEDLYFDRIDEPGELKISVLSHSSNEIEGGTEPGEPKDPGAIIDVAISSPSKGKIRVNINPKNEVKVGDSITINASLTSPGEDLNQLFIVKITDKDQKPKKIPDQHKDNENIGLPRLQEVFESPKEGFKGWGDLDFVEMDYSTVMHPFVEGDKLDTIFINMDSSVLKTYKSKLRSEEQLLVADKRYVSAVYFHTLFLYMISKNRKYQITKPMLENTDSYAEIDLSEYLKDIFDSYYSEFLLNFEMNTLIEALAD
ncbi:hypothetical protein [Neptuniibacter sp.]|uniref:hypothetical protein n=1 Tax=Neptuniibacter sp. TaxID=1962643 RepID=UPI00261F9F67|nr:hypothetical protein [Neptuniibacter sp.]